jgi:hypothetical protein
MVQVAVIPLIEWQNERISRIDGHLVEIRSRDALIELLPEMEREVARRTSQLKALSATTFEVSPTVTLEIQRWVTASLASNQIEVRGFDWSPQIDGSLTTVRAQVRVGGRSEDVFEWISMLQLEEAWVSVLTFRLRHADSRNRRRDVFNGILTLEFILEESKGD